MTTPREAAGAINRASVCRVFVAYGEGEGAGTWLPITKVQARELVEHARLNGKELLIEETRGLVSIGDDHDLEDEDGAAEEGPGPVCSECGEPWVDDHECKD